MSTAGPSLWDKSTRSVRLGLALAVTTIWTPLLWAQAADATALASRHKVHAAIDASIQALGGPAWVGVHTSREHVRIATFFQGNPTGEVADAVISREHPNKERVEFDKGRVVEIYSGSTGWEITYKGKKNLPADKVMNHRRWQRHSLRRVLNRFLGDPATVVLDVGSEQVERHSAEQFTLMNAAHNAVKIDIDVASHLPLRISFKWRDPRFHDTNLDAVEFDNYHRIDGVMTPFTVTRTHNGEIVQQTFLLRAQYNVDLPKKLFDPDYAAAHLK
jgi:hypothetical protein